MWITHQEIITQTALDTPCQENCVQSAETHQPWYPVITLERCLLVTLAVSVFCFSCNFALPYVSSGLVRLPRVSSLSNMYDSTKCLFYPDTYIMDSLAERFG